jgi:hypothetical protein
VVRSSGKRKREGEMGTEKVVRKGREGDSCQHHHPHLFTGNAMRGEHVMNQNSVHILENSL